MTESLEILLHHVNIHTGVLSEICGARVPSRVALPHAAYLKAAGAAVRSSSHLSRDVSRVFDNVAVS